MVLAHWTIGQLEEIEEKALRRLEVYQTREQQAYKEYGRESRELDAAEANLRWLVLKEQHLRSEDVVGLEEYTDIVRNRLIAADAVDRLKKKVAHAEKEIHRYAEHVKIQQELAEQAYYERIGRIRSLSVYQGRLRPLP